MNLATNGFIGNKVGIFLLIFILTLILFWKPIIHYDTTTVCGQFIEEGEIRGVDVYVFEYKTRKGDVHRMHESKNHFRIESNELNKMNCIKLEYSNILNFSASVIDERVKKDR